LQFKLTDCLIKIDGKINAIVLDSCSKTACVFEEALASVEIVNSKDIQIQCTTRAPAMTIDGCTAVTYYMPESFAECQVITAKSAAINLIRPTDDDDIIETPIPEQFCTKFDAATSSWVTEAVSHDD
jgi:adenylyl cyclase-associated protein